MRRDNVMGMLSGGGLVKLLASAASLKSSSA